MEDKLLITYALLSHLKETHNSDKGSLVKIFEPIVKKAIVEYAKEKGNSTIMGKSIVEIQFKIKDFFGIEIPSGVLITILRQISDDINNENVFVFHNHGSFIIKSFIFNDIDEDIKIEHSNVIFLQNDYREFCKLNDYEFNFKELLDFIFALKIDLFTDKHTSVWDLNYSIPKYVKLKLKDVKISKIISDIYLGNILSSYLEMKITAPVTNTELLLDTNFLISLLNLNTEEAYLTCYQLYTLCKTMGFRFSMLNRTVDQTKILLNSRIQDFANKDLGLIKESDIFGACIRHNLDKTQLERIKDNIDSTLRKFQVDVIVDSRINQIIDEAKKSQKYKDLITVRNGFKLSALNDTIAYYYVKSRRGRSISEFSDVKCWFLHNSYKSDYEANLGYKIHERNTINANELLTLLWLTNPSQTSINSEIISKGGLATYIAKYRCIKMPTSEIINQINERAKIALKSGIIEERDVYSIGVRMSEGHLTSVEVKDLIEMPDDKFISIVKDYTKQDDEIKIKLSKQTHELNILQETVEDIALDNKLLRDDLANYKFQLAMQTHMQAFRDNMSEYLNKSNRQIIKTTWGYLIFFIVVIIFWFIDKFYSKSLDSWLSAAIALFLMVVFNFLLWFLEHKTILQCLKYTFVNKHREKHMKDLESQFKIEYELNNPMPVLSDFQTKKEMHEVPIA